MTPLLAALSSWRLTARSSSGASGEPASAASRKRRTWVLSEDFTALLRSRAFSFVPMRLIWDLIFATREASSSVRGQKCAAQSRRREHLEYPSGRFGVQPRLAEAIQARPGETRRDQEAERRA